MSALVAASGLACATYCPRRLYCACRDDDRTPPPAVREVRTFAFDYPNLSDVTDDKLASRSTSVLSAAYHEYLIRLRERDDWDALINPVAHGELLTGKDRRGVTHKFVSTSDGEGDRPLMPAPSLVSSGEPPERGVWGLQRVGAVTLTKAPAWEREAPVLWVLAECLAIGVVRTVELATGNKAAYRRALHVTRDLDFVPSWFCDSTKCESCTYRERCGVKT